MDYPIDYSAYSTDEIIDIIDFLNHVEAYHKNPKAIDKIELKKKHEKFRSIIHNLTEEKKIDKAFLKLTNVSIYQTMKDL
ncbi:MAG: UPF0223 family protein [Candidatus Izemoplasmataceae bacterium]